MAYNGLTNLGVEYLARMTAENKPVTFTKIKVGNGSIPASQTGASTTNLYSLKKEVEILSKNQIENSIKLQVLLNNLDLEVGFYVKELGIYVQDGEQEKLYWYINKDNPSYLPDKNTPSTHRYNLFLEVSNLETNIINFTGEGLLADKKFVEDSINEAFSNFEEEYHETINTLLPKGTVPASLNSAEKIASALQANTGIKFDPDLLYLNYEGTKKVGYCYLDELADGIYECIKETTTTFNDSACFKNISNKNNSDRLDNLSEIYLSISDNDTNDSILEKINSELTKGFFSLVVIFKNTTKNFNILLKKTNLNKIKGIQIIFQKWNSSGEVTISNLASDNLTSGIGDDFNGASYKGTMVGATLTVKTSSGGVYLIQSAHLFNKS